MVTTHTDSRALQRVYSYPYDVVAMCALNPRLDSIFSTLSDLKKQYPDMHPSRMLIEVMTLHPELDTEAIVDDDGFPLRFQEANALDDYFFKVGVTELWRQAYGFPMENARVANGCYATNVGMFTFNLQTRPQ
jgi:hypothetical protein